jgi:hypothetical protein
MSTAFRLIRLVGMALLLASCGGGGGGGGDDDHCSTEAVLGISWTYEPVQDLIFPTGKTTTYKAVLTGLPASCAAVKSFSVSTGYEKPWLSIDASTGDISGSPKDPYICVGPDPIGPSGGCDHTGEFNLHLPGYSSQKKRVILKVRRP